MANIDQLNQLLFKEFQEVISVIDSNQHHINIKNALLKKDLGQQILRSTSNHLL
jgi:hypothetical protein